MTLAILIGLLAVLVAWALTPNAPRRQRRVRGSPVLPAPHWWLA